MKKSILARAVEILVLLFEIFIWLPFFVYRVLLIEYVKIFRQDFGQVLNPQSTAMMEDLRSAYNIALMFSIKLEGKLTLSRITQLFESNVLEARLENEIRYPQLKQHPVIYCGYWFWKPDGDFNIRNHIHEWKESGCNKVSKLHQNIVNRSWNSNKSPWELILITGDNQSSHLFLRMHHCMADGKSMIKLLVEGLGQKQQKVAKPNYVEKGFWNKLFLPLAYIKMIFAGKKYIEKLKGHPWNLTERTRPGVIPKTWVALAQPILKKLKSIAKRNNVYPSSVIMSIVSGSVAKLYGNSFKNETLNCLYVVLKPNHPPTLTNHSFVGGINFNMEAVTSQLRLRMCNEAHKKLKNSSVPKCVDMSVYQMGSWTEGVRKSMSSKTDFVWAVTNMSADDEGFDVGDLPCTNIAASIGQRYGSIGVTFMTVGYMDMLQVTVLGNSLIISELEVQALSKEVKKEFDQLCVENGL